jgi:hypothetical protein
MIKTVALDTAALTEELTADAIVELSAEEISAVSGGGRSAGGEVFARLGGEVVA